MFLTQVSKYIPIPGLVPAYKPPPNNRRHDGLPLAALARQSVEVPAFLYVRHGGADPKAFLVQGRRLRNRRGALAEAI
jgi:hypothetical protein